MGGEKWWRCGSLLQIRGSPPRGRGKVFAAALCIDFLGITPAWAGKSLFCFTAAVPIQDHPRMGGEKCSRWDYTPAEWGSPPHGRGKEVFPFVPFLPLGITPAWAGKSYRVYTRLCGRGDHPRMGGEKLPRLYSPMWPWGSPPRRRGKVQLDDPEEGDLGITPA